MTTRIEPTDGYRWDSHTAWVHLRKDWQQLSVDALSDAAPRVIAADKAVLDAVAARDPERAGRLIRKRLETIRAHQLFDTATK